MIYHGDCTIDCGEHWHHHVELLRMIPAGSKLYTAPQQEAQEPVAWYVTGCSRLLDEDEAKAEARHIGGTARAIPLYTVPQADSVLEDAARLEFEMQHGSAIAAARKQGANHG